MIVKISNKYKILLIATLMIIVNFSSVAIGGEEVDENTIRL